MSRRLPRPCLDCGKLVQRSRCDKCAAAASTRWANGRDPEKRKHYTGDYKRKAKAVREAPGPCWLCGEGDRPDDPWQADHVIAGRKESPLAKAHRSCNASRGRGELAPGGVKP